LLSQLKTLEYQFELQESERALETKRFQLRLIFIGILIIIAIATIFIFILKRNLNRQKDLLNIVNNKNEIILKQNGELEQINAEKDRFFAILAHDLKGPIKAISASLTFIKEDLDHHRYEEASKMTSAITASAVKASELLSNLVEWAKSQQGKIKVNPQDTDVQYLVKNSLDLLQEAYSKKGISIDNLLVNPIPVHTDKEILATVIRNVLSNAIKYSHAGGLITIECTEVGSNLRLCIQDEGIGMSEKMIQSIFKIDSNNCRPGTAGEVSSGLGLILCKEFLAYVNGEIQVDSKENQGTKVTVNFPLNT
jgi:signal transduction histidine kinase